MSERKEINKSSLGFFSGRLSTVTIFIVLNGFILATLAFLLVRLTTNDMKMMDAVAATRDISQMTEQVAGDIQRKSTILASLYAAYDAGKLDEATLRAKTNQISMGPAATGTLPDGSGYVWMTDKGHWQFDSLSPQTASLKSFDPLIGYPDYDLFKDVIDTLGIAKPRYLSGMDWKALQSDKGSPLGKLAVKTRLADGGMGVLILSIPKGRIFGEMLGSKQEQISHVVVKDAETGELIIDIGDTSGESVFSKSTQVHNLLLIGDRHLDISFSVKPVRVSRYIDMAPLGGAVLVLLMSVLAAILAQRNQRQNKKLAEMSETLEDAHHELQSKKSERDKLLHALRKSERENRAIVNSVSDVIFETDEAGKIVFLNETWKRMTQRDVQDTRGKSLFDMLQPSDQARHRDMFEELVRGVRQAYREEARFDVGNGIYKPVELAFSMLRMAEDKSIRVVGTITDIEKRRRAETALRAAEHRFRSIFENSISGIYQTSPDGHILNANPALAEILGYSSPEDLILSVTDIGNQIYTDQADRENFVSKLLFEGRILGFESQVRRKDGRVIWITENARVVHSEKGGVAYYEGNISDITERKQSEEALRQARTQAEMSERSRMDFLSNMSHELRTPLNAVIGFSEIIKDELLGPVGVKEYKEYAYDIYNSGNNLLRVISEILEFSKIASGNRELNISSFRLAKAIKSCLVIMGSRIQQSGIDLVVNLPEDLPEVLAEELGIKQVMLNLLSNAVKFTDRGGRIEIAAAVQPDGQMFIDVIDTGIGMNKEDVKRAMEPFAKLDMSFSGMKEGTGLGLTIAESIMKLHSGELTLISEKGAGTTARIIIPAFRVLREHNVPDAQHLKVVK